MKKRTKIATQILEQAYARMLIKRAVTPLFTGGSMLPRMPGKPSADPIQRIGTGAVGLANLSAGGAAAPFALAGRALTRPGSNANAGWADFTKNVGTNLEAGLFDTVEAVAGTRKPEEPTFIEQARANRRAANPFASRFERNVEDTANVVGDGFAQSAAFTGAVPLKAQKVIAPLTTAGYFGSAVGAPFAPAAKNTANHAAQGVGLAPIFTPYQTQAQKTQARDAYSNHLQQEYDREIAREYWDEYGQDIPQNTPESAAAAADSSGSSAASGPVPDATAAAANAAATAPASTPQVSSASLPNPFASDDAADAQPAPTPPVDLQPVPAVPTAQPGALQSDVLPTMPAPDLAAGNQPIDLAAPAPKPAELPAALQNSVAQQPDPFAEDDALPTAPAGSVTPKSIVADPPAEQTFSALKDDATRKQFVVNQAQKLLPTLTGQAQTGASDVLSGKYNTEAAQVFIKDNLEPAQQQFLAEYTAKDPSNASLYGQGMGLWNNLGLPGQIAVGLGLSVGLAGLLGGGGWLSLLLGSLGIGAVGMFGAAQGAFGEDAQRMAGRGMANFGRAVGMDIPETAAVDKLVGENAANQIYNDVTRGTANADLPGIVRDPKLRNEMALKVRGQLQELDNAQRLAGMPESVAVPYLMHAGRHNNQPLSQDAAKQVYRNAVITAQMAAATDSPFSRRIADARRFSADPDKFVQEYAPLVSAADTAKAMLPEARNVGRNAVNAGIDVTNWILNAIDKRQTNAQ